jgi:hypothetical protein
MHVLGYNWQDFVPSLFYRENGEFGVFPLKGSLNLEILPEKQCIGSRNADRSYSLCENAVGAWKTQCKTCEAKDVWLPCVKCKGNTCFAGEEAKNFCETAKFCVYLALFGSIVKVGVSAEKRLTERFLEQGADMGVKIAFGNGRTCRQLEAKISGLGIRDAVSYQTKIISLHQLYPAALRNTFSHVKSKFSGIEDCFEPIDLSRYYLKIMDQPRYLHVEPMMLNDKILGAKGQLLFLESGYVLDMKRLVARKVRKV